MREFEMSIKSTPSGASVYLNGAPGDLIVQLGVLASALSKRSGAPLDLLAEMVLHGDDIEERITKSCVSFDLRAIKQPRGEQ